MLHLFTLSEQCELNGRLFSLQCQQHGGEVQNSVCCLKEPQCSIFFSFVIPVPVFSVSTQFKKNLY